MMGDAQVDEEQDEAEVRLVCFWIAGQELALPIEAVRETIPLLPITRVFLTPPWLSGIFSLRGEIVPVLDLAQWLGLPATTVSDETRLVVLRHPARAVAILVDGMAQLRTVPERDLAPPPSTLSIEQLSLLSAVAATPTGTVRVLAPAAIMGGERLAALSGAALSEAAPPDAAPADKASADIARFQ
ncbi:MAG: purine-binding chemotaxis protein CheW [Polyangiaceae bacterium]|nr:purine-binding chemotaxis protein CheW [Polyangiaceae bacterium]MBK8941082.1 purine-binding chemotaxis protein CheW [Polyangiaceae bacterium]